MSAPHAPRYIWRLVALWAVLTAAYLAIAWGVLAPMGYYGGHDHPRFQDPWLARASVILEGKLLYRDVFTSTPPLTNYLLLPPALAAEWAGGRNPAATLAFMLYYALFALAGALILLRIPEERAEGYRAARLYLACPLTLGNAILHRQDETVLATFFALALWALVRRCDVRAGVAIGLTLLIKLTGAILLPVAWLNRWRWQHVALALVVFAVVLAPFLALAGPAAMFWDVGQQDTEHPFQLGGISLGAMWAAARPAEGEAALWIQAIVFLLAVLATLTLIALRPQGVLEDAVLLLGGVLCTSPKSHPGYFVVLGLAMATIARRYRLTSHLWLSSALVLLSSLCKDPLEAYWGAFALMLTATVVLAEGLWRLRRAWQPDPARPTLPVRVGGWRRWLAMRGAR